MNQGYLFELNDQMARVLAERLNLDELPSEIAQPMQQLLDDQWASFILWGKKFFETGSTREHERNTKLVVTDKLSRARDLLLEGASEWTQTLKQAFGSPNNLTFHIAHTRFLDWCFGNVTEAGALLRRLWAEEGDESEAISRFLGELPPEAATGSGTRTNLATFLGMVRSPHDFPVFKTEPFETGCRLVAYEPPPKKETNIYPHALAFLDRIIREASERGLELRDRLDAQCLLWCVTKYEPPKDWPEEERQAFTRWREGMDRPGPADADGLAALADRLLIDVKFLKEIERLTPPRGAWVERGRSPVR